jgi:hypothetical protein
VQISNRIFDDHSLLVWASSGTATSKNTVVLIAVADANGTVLGFGFPGFEDSKWKALIISQRRALLIYGVTGASHACPFESAAP